MKKLVRFMFCILLVFTLAFCKNNSKQISILYYDHDDIFLNQFSKKLTDKISKNYKYKNYYATKSQLKQNLQVDSLLDSSSLFIMNMVDRLASGAIVEKCKKKNKPIIFFNREPLLEDMADYDLCYYVGPDPDKQGYLQVECAASIFGDPTSLSKKYDKNNDNIIQLVILKGEQGHQDAERRTQACLSYLRQKGYSIELLSIGVCNWNRTEAYNLFWSQYASTLKDCELVLANNDEMAIGAASYIRSAIPAEEEIIPIIGVDATEDGIAAVNSKLLASTIINDDTSQVDAIVKLSDILLKKGDISDFEYPITNGKFVYIDSRIYES